MLLNEAYLALSANIKFQPVTFNNMQHERVSTIMVSGLVIFNTVLHVTRGEILHWPYHQKVSCNPHTLIHITHILTLFCQSWCTVLAPSIQIGLPFSQLVEPTLHPALSPGENKDIQRSQTRPHCLFWSFMVLFYISSKAAATFWDFHSAPHQCHIYLSNSLLHEESTLRRFIANSENRTPFSSFFYSILLTHRSDNVGLIYPPFLSFHFCLCF